MYQKLILPINKCMLTVGYKNSWYPKNYRGQIHYGVDMVHRDGLTTLYGCGEGVVSHCGYDEVCGNVLIVKYANCLLKDNRLKNIVVRYFHLDRLNVRVGDKINIDTVLGYYGKTGVQVNGAHLHVECDLDYDYPSYTPCLKGNSNILKASPKGYPDTTINPTLVFYIKESSPEKQMVGVKYSGSVSQSDLKYEKLR